MLNLDAVKNLANQAYGSPEALSILKQMSEEEREKLQHPYQHMVEAAKQQTPCCTVKVVSIDE